jgi:hypothetical protein
MREINITSNLFYYIKNILKRLKRSVDLQSARVKLKHLLGKCYISIIITEYHLYLSFFNFSESIKLFVLLIFGGIDDHITV